MMGEVSLETSRKNIMIQDMIYSESYNLLIYLVSSPSYAFSNALTFFWDTLAEFQFWEDFGFYTGSLSVFRVDVTFV